MKRFVLSMLALGCMASFPTASYANEKMTPEERTKKLDKMAKELNLSADQKEKVRAIKDEKYTKIEAAQTDAHNQIRGVLNPDQQVKFDKMMEKKH